MMFILKQCREETFNPLSIRQRVELTTYKSNGFEKREQQTQYGRINTITTDKSIVMEIYDYGIILFDSFENPIIRVMRNGCLEARFETKTSIDSFLKNIHIRVEGNLYNLVIHNNELMWKSLKVRESQVLEVGSEFSYKELNYKVTYIGKEILVLFSSGLNREISIDASNKQRMNTMGIYYHEDAN